MYCCILLLLSLFLVEIGHDQFMFVVSRYAKLIIICVFMNFTGLPICWWWVPIVCSYGYFWFDIAIAIMGSPKCISRLGTNYQGATSFLDIDIILSLLFKARPIGIKLGLRWYHFKTLCYCTNIFIFLHLFS